MTRGNNSHLLQPFAFLSGPLKLILQLLDMLCTFSQLQRQASALLLALCAAGSNRKGASCSPMHG